MAEDKIDRREAMSRLKGIVALAAGVSVMELDDLLAAEVKRVSPTTAKTSGVYQKSASQKIKTLKVMVENDRRVFESEFGRITPKVKRPIESMLSRPEIPRDMMGQMVDVCGTNFGMPGAGGFMTGLICKGTNNMFDDGMGGGSKCTGINNCSGGQACILSGCSPNTCDGQNCKHDSCSPNNCTGYDCRGFKSCEPNNQSIISAATLNRYRTDPYVQLLMNRFQVRTTTELVTEIHSMLRHRRQQFIRNRPDLTRQKQRFIQTW